MDVSKKKGLLGKGMALMSRPPVSDQVPWLTTLLLVFLIHIYIHNTYIFVEYDTWLGECTHSICHCEAMTKAMNLAQSCGETDVTALLGTTKQDLSGHEDITNTILEVPQIPLGPNPPSSTVVCQKAALVSFQSWTFRSPEIVGVLLGSVQGKRTVGQSLVVGETYEEVIGSQKVPVVCEREQLFPCGVVFCAGDDVCKNRERAIHYLSDIKSRGFEDPLCVMVTGFC